MQAPKFIAICGVPGCGKSTVQEFLAEMYGVVPVDDGRWLRDITVQYLGASEYQVTTQSGKQEIIKINDRDWQVRKALGELGKALEDLFGEHITPFVATRLLPPGYTYSFGSVRKGQGWFYAERGGVVLEVKNPRVEHTGNAFDLYDPMAVEYTIHNDGSKDDLRKAVQAFGERYALASKLAA